MEGSQKVLIFCHKSKTIKHLFFECCFVRVVCGRIYVALTFLNPIVVLICLGVGFGLAVI